MNESAHGDGDVSAENPVSENWVWGGTRRKPWPRTMVEQMTTGWAPQEPSGDVHPMAPYCAQRRERVAGLFPGRTLVVANGNPKVRANDTDYRFRPDSDFFYLTACDEPDAVLVVSPARRARARPSTSRTAATSRRTSSSPTLATASSGSARAAASRRRPSSSPSRPRRWSTWRRTSRR